jgi:branched-chain amino acid transport system substrate-binding protein
VAHFCAICRQRLASPKIWIFASGLSAAFRSSSSGAAGYIIPDFEKGLGEFAEDVLSIAPTNYDLAPALTDKFRKRFGFFMVHEAVESAVTLDVLIQAIERAKSAKPRAVTEALHGGRFDAGWTKAMPGGAVQFDQSGLNMLLTPIMVQWRKKELVTVWPKDFAKASPDGTPGE